MFLAFFHLQATDAPLTNGLDKDVKAVTGGVNELTFEEDEEEAFFTKDLPAHACA